MSRIQDITGQRYGKLVVMRYVGLSKHRRTIWLCQCDCGNTTEVLANSLKSGRTLSCKCYNNERSANRKRKHGLAGTTEYTSWNGMIQRCTNPNQPQYKDYGGRGIKVCDRWLNSFESFIEDMGMKPTPNYSIEREMNNGNYEPANCKWATPKEQNNNKRSNRAFSYNGETLSIKEWAERLNIHKSTIYKYKTFHNLSIDEAFKILYHKHAS